MSTFGSIIVCYCSALLIISRVTARTMNNTHYFKHSMTTYHIEDSRHMQANQGQQEEESDNCVAAAAAVGGGIGLRLYLTRARYSVPQDIPDDNSKIHCLHNRTRHSVLICSENACASNWLAVNEDSNQ
eukprot:scaffold60646_cov38-Prasinocladus_malaysianus.AAC.1